MKSAFSKVFREGVVVLKELRGLSFHLINILIHVHVVESYNEFLPHFIRQI